MTHLPRKPIRGLIVDVDGTLTDRDRVLNFEVAKALRMLSARGLPIVMATGNVLPIALGLQRFLGLKGPIIADNGGMVYFSEERIVRLGSREVALRAYEKIRESLPVRLLFTDRWRETEVALVPDQPVEKILPLVAGMGVKVENTGFAIHLIEPSAGKLPAARVALEPFGLEVGECLVAGDGDNDVELMKAASVSVSFPEAMPLAREVADYVSDEGDGAGLLEALERFDLLEESEDPGLG
jgi:hypothetical protein